MTKDHSLIERLEVAFDSASAETRLAVLDQVTALFVSDADKYSADQIALFDEVLLKLSVDIEAKARRKLARSLARLRHPPQKTIERLGRDPNPAVASPVLRQVLQLQERDIIEVAKNGSQAHLYALARRAALNETITDILVDRGARRVACCVANNVGARLSDAAFGKLVTRASADDTLAQAVGTRRDIPRHHFVKLLLTASASVRIKLAAADPYAARNVESVVAEIACGIGQNARVISPDPELAEAEIERLCHPDRSGDVNTKAAAHARKVEQAAKALSSLCRVPIDVAEHALTEKKAEMVLILAKAAGCSWKTTKSLLLIQAGDHAPLHEDLQHAREDFERLQPATARQVIERYRVRTYDPEAFLPEIDDGKTRAPAA